MGLDPICDLYKMFTMSFDGVTYHRLVKIRTVVLVAMGAALATYLGDLFDCIVAGCASMDHLAGLTCAEIPMSVFFCEIALVLTEYLNGYTHGSGLCKAFKGYGPSSGLPHCRHSRCERQPREEGPSY